MVGSRRTTIEEAHPAFAAGAASVPTEQEVNLLGRIQRFFGLRA
jgi:hypothetical protein